MVCIAAANLAGSLKTAFKSALHQAKENHASGVCFQGRVRCARTSGRGGRGATTFGSPQHAQRFEQIHAAADRLARAQQTEMLMWEQVRAKQYRSLLDFNPAFRFRRSPNITTTASPTSSSSTTTATSKTGMQSQRIPYSTRQQQPWAWGGKRVYIHYARRWWRPRNDGKRSWGKLFFMETWLTTRLRYNNAACPAHGTQATHINTGGIGGGKQRLKYDRARWKAWHNATNRAHYRHHRRQERLARLRVKPRYAELVATSLDRQGCEGHRVVPAIGIHVTKRQTSDAANDAVEHHKRKACTNLFFPYLNSDGQPLPGSINTLSRSNSSSSSGGFLQPRRLPRGGHGPGSSYGGSLLISPPPLRPHPASFVGALPNINFGISRAFHSSSVRRHLPLAVAAAAAPLAKIFTLLKSSTALHYINLLFRVSVSFIPLSLKRAAWARKAKIAQLAGVSIVTPYWATAFRILCRTALGLPFVLLVLVLLAALERTPITGRLRLMLLNSEEEKEIVDKVLELGAITEPKALNKAATDGTGLNDVTAASAVGQRDWLNIMRTVLGESEAPAGTLLGGRVLDNSDWRVHLVESVLSKLEAGIPELAFTSSESSSGRSSSSTSSSMTNSIEPPPLSHPLHKSVRSGHLEPKNAVIVIDRPESNAFSFGFFGSTNQPAPGVIIFFTGAIDEIMQASSATQVQALQHLQKDLNSAKGQWLANGEQSVQALAHQHHHHLQPSPVHALINEPSWLRSFFGSLLPSGAQVSMHDQQQLRLQGHGAIVSREQEEALSVLVAHELAHLVLSHTIESYASTALLWPQLEKLGWDMLRVFIYPVTAILGPFVGDAISASFKVGIEESAEGRGFLPTLTSSCESKKLEFEADKVALRLMANAGIDPRSAIQFWEDRLARESSGHDQHHDHDHRHHQHGAIQQDLGMQNTTTMRTEVRHMQQAQDDANSFVKTHPAGIDRIAAIRKELSTWRTIVPQTA